MKLYLESFILVLILVSISPLSNWRLDQERPLDEDDLLGAEHFAKRGAVGLHFFL